MKNVDVIVAFFNGKVANTVNVRSFERYDGTLVLENYNTILVQKTQDGGYIFNETKYSPTTSKIQTYIRCEMQRRNIKYKSVNNVPYNTRQLNNF